MDKKTIEQAIEVASEAAGKATDFRGETYLAVLISTLLRGSSLAVQVGPTEPRSFPKPSEPTTRLSEKSYSAAELFASAKWETEIEKVTLAGRFLERHAGAQSYGLNEIRTCLVSAKVPLPANLSLALLKAVQKGWLMEIPGQQSDKYKAWSLTQTGERKTDQMLSAAPQ